MKGNFYIYTAAVTSMLFWGMSYVWSTIVFRYYSPVSTVFFRLLISSILLILVLKISGTFEKINKSDYKLFLASALFNPFLYFFAESYGLKYSSSTLSAVIIATIPLFTPVVAYYTLGEKLTRLNIAGMIVSFCGILLMIINNDFSLNSSPLGILLLLLAVASAIVYSVFLRKLGAKYSAVSIIAVQNLIGTLYYLPIFLIFELKDVLMVKPDLPLVSSLLALAVFCSSAAYILYTLATKAIGISRTNLFANLIPVFAGIFSYIILGESFTVLKIFGMGIVILGLYLSQMKKSPPVIYYG